MVNPRHHSEVVCGLSAGMATLARQVARSSTMPCRQAAGPMRVHGHSTAYSCGSWRCAGGAHLASKPPAPCLMHRTRELLPAPGSPSRTTLNVRRTKGASIPGHCLRAQLAQRRCYYEIITWLKQAQRARLPGHSDIWAVCTHSSFRLQMLLGVATGLHIWHAGVLLVQHLSL